MKLKLTTLAACALLCAAAAPDEPFAEALSSYTAPGRPGCATGIVEDGRLTHARGWGAADIETGRPIAPATPFNLASMSKQFTGAAVALLIAEGALSEENDVRRYLPELPDYGASIRLRHLIHHSSGLRNHMALAAFQPTGPLPSHEEALALVFRQSALNFEPGARHQYESPNYVLLAEIVERVSGKPFGEFLAERFFEPLGMRNTGFAPPGLARAYAAGADGRFTLNEKVNRARGSSGLVSTVEDLAIWLDALATGRVAGGDLLDRMTAGGRLDDGTPIAYGFGLAVERDHAGQPGLMMISHGGQTAAFRSTFSYFPAHGFGAIMLCNVSDAPLGAAQEVVTRWVAERFSAPPAPAVEGRPLPAGEAERLAGVYHDRAGDQLRAFAAENGALALSFFGQAYPLAWLGEGRFLLDGLGTFRFRDTPAGIAMTAEESDQPPIDFTRLDPPGPWRGTDYAGSYRSADVDGRLTIRAGEQLMMVLPESEIALEPIQTDGFRAPGAGFGRIAFTRDRSGRVTGLTLTTLSGISRMRFERVEDRAGRE